MERTKRYLARKTAVIVIAFSLLFGFAAGAMAANARLYDADANLEKAHVLLEAARDDGMAEMEGRAYDRVLRRAQRDIDRARARVARAIAIADAP